MRFKERISVFDIIRRIWGSLFQVGSKRRTLKIGLHFGFALILLAAFSPSISAAESIRLAWDENSEPDIAGYKIYYRTGSSGSRTKAFYNGSGIEEGNSPVNVPADEDQNLDPRFVEVDLHGLNENQDYYFVVTAYNTSGLESAPSNEASLVRAVATESSSNQVAASASGGGGGGCFISVLSGNEE
jgi:hypothetical protein